MPKKGVEQSHSRTAMFAALFRTVANKELKNNNLGGDYLAAYFLPSFFRLLIKLKKVRYRVKQRNARLTPGVYEYMIARTAYFDAVFSDALKLEVPQIVLLGAGYDTRAFRFANLNLATRVFEVDIETTQSRKIACLQKAGIELPERTVLVSMDFNKASLGPVLNKAGFDHHQHTLFLWEGVSYYLDPKSVDATLEFIARGSSPDSVIVFDYGIRITAQNADSHYGVKALHRFWNRRRVNEPIRFSIEEGEIAPFLKERGLRVVEHLDNKQIEHAFLTREDGSLIGRPNGVFRLVKASPIPN